MIYFDSDYMAGAHPEVLRRLVETNLQHTVGYGTDHYCKTAEKLILNLCGIDHGEVYFFEGGTQANATVIQQLLRHYEGVIATDTAHINVHEAGAIEAGGHKVLVLPGKDGKLSASQIEEYVTNFYADDTCEHMVAPGMVYISFPTELGTIYSRGELEAIRTVCDRFSMPLFIDGARLAYGLYAAGDNLTLRDIAALSDVFYIGGTKCGALFGEAMVTRRPELFRGFRSLIKQRGGTLAKGRLLGLQFITLMENNLYDTIGRQGVEMAMMLKKGFLSKGVEMLMDSPTNQQFFILPNDTIVRIRDIASFEYWGTPGQERSAVRFVTDWSTSVDDIRQLIEAI